MSFDLESRPYRLNLEDYRTDPTTMQRIGNRPPAREDFSRLRQLGHRITTYAATAGGFEIGWFLGADVVGVEPGLLVGLGVAVLARKWTRRQLPY